MDSAPATATVDNLGKKFSGASRWAVRGLSFTCHPGQVIGMLGENGAGKTTTLRLLATMLAPSEGHAVIEGHSVASAPSRVRRSVGILFGGSSGLYERLSARENVLYFAGLNGLDRHQAARNLKSIVELLGMGDFLDIRAGAFSTGMRQKTLIARAIIHNPALLLLDEPATGLDLGTARSVYAFIDQYRRLGNSVIFSSHDLQAVARISDSILILHRGTLVDQRNPRDFSAPVALEEHFMQLTGGPA